MSVPIPADLELLDENALVGRVKAGEEPLRTLMRRINWSYCTHAPPLVDVCPYVAAKAAPTIIVPVAPSADSLSYTAIIVIEATAAASLTWTISSATSYGGTYSLVASSFFTTTTGSVRSETLTAAASIPPSATHIKLELSIASGTVKVHQFLVHPSKLAILSAGSYPSGVTVYEDTDLEVGTGDGAIHTEYLNRAWDSARALAADRVQMVAGFVAESGGLRFSAPLQPWKGGVHQYVIVGPVAFPDNGDHEVKFRVLANDTGTAYIRVGQVGGNQSKLTVTGSELTATLTLTGKTPVIYVMVQPDNGTDVTYVSVEYAADHGSATAVIGEPAPPARVEYLAAIDALQLEVLLTPYVGALRSFDWPSLSGAGLINYWYTLNVIPPGTRALRVMTVQSSDGGSSVQDDPTVWGAVDGWTSSDAVSFPSNQTGGQRYPPSIDSKLATGGEGYDAAATAESDRLLTTTEDREPVTMAVRANNCVGMTLIPYSVANIRDV